MTVFQGATEFMLAMGLEDKMVGTSYIDDTIWPRYAEAPTYYGCLVHTRLCGSTYITAAVPLAFLTCMPPDAAGLQ